ncbi:hypothetical protein BDV96DRAFT_86634 [Lophiotrema nucula]|uniref:Uncharacterized protein n=1 Tax=Lophiotrema nucula TaxID=690887 RepID=A0A6A5Z8Y6_9PLEO|nr:hypothetical protein BDV96DRAFT_86634 [Lophiotrema nucula]
MLPSILAGPHILTHTPACTSPTMAYTEEQARADAAKHGDTIARHKDTAKHSGDAAEHFAKQAGFGKYAKKIGELVSKLVGKKQKEYTAGKDTAAKPAAPVDAQPAPVTAH